MGRAERWSEVVTHHGEGPCWDADAGALRCVDLLAGDLVSFDAAGRAERSSYDDRVLAAWRPRRGGGLVLGVERGFALVDPDGATTRLPALWDDPTVRMNDGACDLAGRFYCGSMSYSGDPGAGRLWRLDPDRSVHVVLEGVTISNGLCWNRDGSAAYYVDTPTGRIDRLRLDEAGDVVERRTHARVDPADGAPDGLTVDAEGGVWVALWGGGAVRRYSPDGVLSEVVEVPARQVTACAFGGPGLDHLYVTTSRHGLGTDAEPDAGAVFRFRPGVPGLPTPGFAG